MTSHTGHTHPATRAARAVCRRDHRTPVELGYRFAPRRQVIIRPDLSNTVRLVEGPVARTGRSFTVTTHQDVTRRPSAWANRVTGPMGDWFTSESIALHTDGMVATANRARVRTEADGTVVYTHPHPYRCAA